MCKKKKANKINFVENIRVVRNGRATIVMIMDKNLKVLSKGIAKCHPKDKFNKEYGFILAYQRAKEAQLYPKIKEAKL